MKLIRDPLSHSLQSVVTIGNFDGLHKGHQQLVAALRDSAAKLRLSSVLLTFEPNPVEFFSLGSSLARLMRFSEKWRSLEAEDIDYFYCMRFNAALASLSPLDFVKTILVDQLGAKKVIVGDDFHFGAKRAGDVYTLAALGEQYGFEVQAVPQAMHEGERISSSRVRKAVQAGDFEKVSELTSRSFSISGKVAYGSQIGRQLGYPTANIHLHRKQAPLMGIFVARVYGLGGDPLAGVASVGYRPTFNGKQVLLEVHLFDFNEVIYGRHITVEFLHKIRDEVKFESVPELVLQIEDDVEVARQYFMAL